MVRQQRARALAWDVPRACLAVFMYVCMHARRLHAESNMLLGGALSDVAAMPCTSCTRGARLLSACHFT